MYILVIYNNLINFITGFTFNELIYRFKVNNNLLLLENLLAENYNKLRKIKKNITKNVIAFVLVVTKTKYNFKYCFLISTLTIRNILPFIIIIRLKASKIKSCFNNV